ncbi:MAG: hypothetical protein BWK80_41255 [Desulfobacteraceae bacterium IS3]|nr:MAG: hypothetical protein BWK80_41255 [Desulfobacteraceae bacterium IS3]
MKVLAKHAESAKKERQKISGSAIFGSFAVFALSASFARKTCVLIRVKRFCKSFYQPDDLQNRPARKKNSSKLHCLSL